MSGVGERATATPGSAPVTWRQLQFEVPRDDLPALETLLELAGALVTWTEDAGNAPVLEPAPGETPLWPRLLLTALFDPGVTVGAVQAAVADLDPAIASSLRSSEVADRDWDADWRRTLKPLHYGEHLWVCPPGQTAPDPEAVRVELEPGLAFGTGTHPTTGLCLAWLAGETLTGARVLDYGCGSGILAVAALAMGAASVTAIDIDPQAITATRANAARNGCGERLRAGLPEELPEPLPTGPGHDVVMANILSGPLIRLAPLLAGQAASGSRVALSGILAEQADEVVAAWAPFARLAEAARLDGWVLLTGERII